MVKGSKWTAGEELSISYAFIGRSERADVGTNMRSSQFFEGIRVDMLARRTQYPETMNDSRYWHARSLAAVRSRWLDVIAPECTKLSACYAVVARQHKTGCTDEDLTNMAIASYNHVTYIPDAPSSCGFFAHLSSWKILRHHPRFLAVFPTPTSTRPARPSSSVDVDGVPGAPPNVRGDGTPAPSPSSASGCGRSTVAVGLPGPMPTGSKRTKDQAGLLAASASIAKRVKELTDASSSKSQTLKNMERSMFFNTSAMRNTQAARDFQQRTAARMLAEMAEEDREAAARQAQAAAERR